MTPARRLYKSGRYATSEASELLQGLLIAELLAPSSRLWLISPWITDFPAIDNRSLAFERLVDDWGPRYVRLSEFVRILLMRGGNVVVVTRPNESVDFLTKVKAGTDADATTEALLIVTRDRLHEKGILSDSYHLSGSMNLTYSGVQINDEVLILDTDPNTLANARATYDSRYQSQGLGSA